VLVDGHDPQDWAQVLGALLGAPGRRAELARGAVEHARGFSWDRTATGLLAVYGEAVTAHRIRVAAELAGRAAALGAGAW
jgi:D-inositol-3-phosphate glycosyltransferase